MACDSQVTEDFATSVPPTEVAPAETSGGYQIISSSLQVQPSRIMTSENFTLESHDFGILQIPNVMKSEDYTLTTTQTLTIETQ